MVADSLSFCIEKKGLRLYGYVMMRNHIHLLVPATDNNLPDVLRDFKQFTSQHISKAIEGKDAKSRKRWLMWLVTSEKVTDDMACSFRSWQPDHYARICFHLPFLWRKPVSIDNNPVRAGIVDRADAYKSRRAADCFLRKAGGTGEDCVAGCDGCDPVIVLVSSPATCFI